MNQGGHAQTVAQLDPNSVENRYCVDANQMQTSSYQYATAGSDAASWATNKGVNHTTDTISYSNSSYHYTQPTGQTTNSIQDSSSSASFPSSSTSGTTNVVQDYTGHASYTTSTDPYGYGNTGYSSYYNGYQQQPNQSYPQAAGACQNSGAPYQPLSSFQNTGSYASYSGTYYNPANYQTSGGYTSTGYTNQGPQGYSSASYTSQSSGGYPGTTYSNQTASWTQGNHTNYSANAYPSYTPDTSTSHSSSTAAATPQHYQQNYKQWADYYSQTEVTCAPGTENLSASGTSNQTYAAPGVSCGITTSNSQPTPSYAQPWRPDNTLSQNPSYQPGAAANSVNDCYWTHHTPNFQNHHPAPTQNQYLGSASPKFSFDAFQDPQKSTPPHGLNSQSSHQLSPIYQQPVQTLPSFDTRRVSKLQIPTNPRIPSNFPLGLPKTGKETSATTKPAYVSILPPKPSGDTDNSMLKSGAFPKSLRGYVERALSRCKNDKEKASCQASLKEIITKARADGTLYSRDWDTEPLLPVLSRDLVNHEIQSAAPISSLLKKSPTRRSKSRWEPLLQENEFHKSPSASSNAVKFGGWSQPNEKDKKSLANSQKVDTFSSYRSPLSEQAAASKSIQRPAKRQRQVVGSDATVNDDASSDSDKEESLTPYYSSAMSLANSAEEIKRRECRSKRFEKGRGHRRENNLKSKTAIAGNLYSRRATALMLSKTFDDSGNRAVEDIDWDALTVKGTCQEIEKRYLRLTSAPDPSTVRPEDVLEKALEMVQNSQKNYLYKCDQLKSIRQDLTVQRIHNQLTAKVYETHARFALGAGDLPEYNQCLSQLNILYAEGIEGCHFEFAAYNLLYVILHSNNNRELLSSMSRLSTDAKKDDAVKHALAVRSAVTSGNYVKFFRLYRAAPNLNTFLMDLYVEKMRYRAVSCMSRANRPTVPVSYIAQVLGFAGASCEEGDEKDAATRLEECVEWLKAHGASLISDNNGEMQLDAKVSASNLYMPEPEDAVAHGDPNLAVNDFFTKTMS